MPLQSWEFLVTSAGVIGGLIFSGLQRHSEAETRRISNLLQITSNQREIWFEYIRDPSLARVRDPNAAIEKQGVTQNEEIFVLQTILHLQTVFVARKSHQMINQEGLQRDVRGMFSMPIHAAVWEKMRVLYNEDFVAFVESCRRARN